MLNWVTFIFSFKPTLLFYSNWALFCFHFKCITQCWKQIHTKWKIMLPFLRLVKEFNDPLLLCQRWNNITVFFSFHLRQNLFAVYFHWVVYLVNLSALRPLSGGLRAALPLAPAHPLPTKPVTPGQPCCVCLGSSPISERHQKHKTRVHVSFGQLILPTTGKWIA